MAKSQEKNKEDRRKIDIDLGNSLSLSEFDYMNLDAAIKTLEDLKAGYPGKEVVLKKQGVAYEDYDEYRLYERRLETDSEMEHRQREERKRENAREAHDRAQFEALSKRFGKSM